MRDIRFGERLYLRGRPPHWHWVFRFTAPSGRRREMGLGKAVVVADSTPAPESLEASKLMAAEAARLLAAGVDPIEHRDQVRSVLRDKAQRAEAEAAQQEKARKHWTLARCARDFHERVIEPSRTDKHAAQWIASLENHIPAALWHRPIVEVTQKELLHAILGIKPHDRSRRSGPDLLITKERVAQRLGMVFAEAILQGRASENIAADLGKHIGRRIVRKKVEHMRALPYREAPEFMRRLRNLDGTAARTLEFAVLTAARTGEVLGALWSEVDLEARTWLVPGERMKSSGKAVPEDHLVHLSERAVEILRGQLGQHAAVVFPSTAKADAPQSNMAMLGVLDRMRERHRTTVHGLCRATFSTWANETKAARPEVVEACLAHVLRGAQRPYNRARYHEERAELLDLWAEFLTT